jgi:hypothetical protein
MAELAPLGVFSCFAAREQGTCFDRDIHGDGGARTSASRHPENLLQTSGRLAAARAVLRGVELLDGARRRAASHLGGAAEVERFVEE